MKLHESKKELLRYLPFFLGLILNVFVILLFSKTVISPFLILSLYAIPGILGCLLIRWVKSIDTNLIVKFIYASVSFGCPLAAALLFVNLNIPAATASETVKTNILKRGFTAKTHNPTADVAVDGVIKGFVFPQEKDLAAYSMLRLTLQEGIVGWKTVKEVKLIP
ncbi:MAG: hypothetical protein QM743_10210 [Chitinophagaceae bacterium]